MGIFSVLSRLQLGQALFPAACGQNITRVLQARSTLLGKKLPACWQSQASICRLQMEHPCLPIHPDTKPRLIHPYLTSPTQYQPTPDHSPHRQKRPICKSSSPARACPLPLDPHTCVVAVANLKAISAALLVNASLLLFEMI